MRILICPCSSAFTTLAPKTGASVKAGATAPRIAIENRVIPNLVNFFMIFSSNMELIFFAFLGMYVRKKASIKTAKRKNMSNQNSFFNF